MSLWGYLAAADWMLTSEAKVGKEQRKDLMSQNAAVMVFTSLYAIGGSLPSICGFKTEGSFERSTVTAADLDPADATAAQRRFLIFHSLNLVSLGVVSFQSEHPQKGQALALAFAVPIVTDVINRSLFSKNAYSPWTLSGGIARSGDPILLANYAF